jgi:hypothetical protein
MVQHRSLWERKRAEWHRDAARSEAQAAAGWLPWIFGLAALVLASYGFGHLASLLGWIAIALALGCLVTIQGLRTGREWARWLGGSVAAGLFGIQVTGLTLLPAEHLFSPRGAADVLLTIIWGSIAWRLLGPRGRELSRSARSPL